MKSNTHNSCSKTNRKYAKVIPNNIFQLFFFLPSYQSWVIIVCDFYLLEICSIQGFITYNELYLIFYHQYSRILKLFPSKLWSLDSQFFFFIPSLPLSWVFSTDIKKNCFLLSFHCLACVCAFLFLVNQS